jgi:tryptophanyl-tRNA synthetase
LLEWKYEDGIFPSRVLSGVQPANGLHLGHYIDAIKQHIELQHEYPGESFYFIANYHGLATIHDKELLREQSWNIALDYLALGLDPNKATFYRQSDIPQIYELMWILSCVTKKNLLDRVSLSKEEAGNGFQPSVGLFLYPELMAADILALRATLVPARKDQEQHLEITRNIVKSFNRTFDVQIFPQPSILVSESGGVPGIDGGEMHSVPIQHLMMGERMHLVSSEFFASFEERRKELEKDLDTVEDILRDGAYRAREEAKETLELVRDCIGLGRYQRFVTDKTINR